VKAVLLQQVLLHGPICGVAALQLRNSQAKQKYGLFWFSSNPG
jgi:hypothetical protein